MSDYKFPECDFCQHLETERCDECVDGDRFEEADGQEYEEAA